MSESNGIRKGFLLEKEGVNITSWLMAMPGEMDCPEDTTYSFNVTDRGSRDARDSMSFNSIEELVEAYNQFGLFIQEILKDRVVPDDEEKHKDPEGELPSEELTFKGRYVNSSFSVEPGANHGDEEDAYFVAVNTRTIPAGTLAFSSFDELEDFSRQLSHYMDRQRKMLPPVEEDPDIIS